MKRIHLTAFFDDGRVEIACPDGEPEFGEWMMMAEFLLNVVAKKSPAGFERAIELLTAGAMTYRSKKSS